MYDIWLKLRLGVRHKPIDGWVGFPIGQGSGRDVVYDSRHIVLLHALVLGAPWRSGGRCDHHPMATLSE